MASTIGTNIVQDGEAELKLLETIMQSLEKFYQHEKASKYQEMAKVIGEHISSGGQCAFKLIPSKFSKDIEQELENMNVAFVKLPDTNGNVAFVVRDKDSEKFLEAQRNVFRRSTDFFKHVNLKDIATVAKNNKEKLISIQVSNKNMRLIAQQKLYQSGVVTANGKDNKMYIEQSDYFNKDGDITDFEMQFALEQSMRDVPSTKIEYHFDEEGNRIAEEVPENILEVRKEQASYDKAQIDNFIKRAANGEAVVLGDVYNNSSCYLKAENGQVTFYDTDKYGQKIEKILDIDLSDSNNAYALLAFQSDKIYNMACMDAYSFNELLAGNNEAIANIDKRPNLKGEKSKEIKKLANKDFVNILNKATMIANDRVTAHSNYNVNMPLQNKNLKKNILLGILKSEEMPEIKDFLKEDTYDDKGKLVITKEDKQKWFKDFIDKFEHVNDDDRDDLLIKEESARDILHELENDMDKDGEKSMPEPERV